MKNKKLLRTIALMILFSVIGIFNTAFIDIQKFGSWRHYIGIGFLLLGLIELIILIKILLPDKSAIRVSDDL